MGGESSAYIFLRAIIDQDKEDQFFNRLREVENQFPPSQKLLCGTEENEGLNKKFFLYKGKIFTGLIWVCGPGFPPEIKKLVEAVFSEILKV